MPAIGGRPYRRAKARVAKEKALVKEAARESPLWASLWVVWVAGTVAYCIWGTGGIGLVWVAATFFLLEIPGLLSTQDTLLPLTQELRRHLPGQFTFIILAVGMWRLSHWIGAVWVFALAAWLIWHFDRTYDAPIEGQEPRKEER